jgi:hypothetical protein
VIVLAAIGLAIKDMSGANRPHELTLSPLVSLLLLVNGALLVKAIRASARAWANWPGVVRVLLHLGLWLYAAGCTLLLLVATSTAVEMLMAR